jgi:hypothetical protein
MSSLTFPLGDGELSAGCHRRRLANFQGNVLFSSKSKIIGSDSSVIFESALPICDFVSRDDALFIVTSDGTLSGWSHSSNSSNPSNSYCGLYAALESTPTHFAVAHDLSHSVRFIDPARLETITTAIVPGFINGLCVCSNDRLSIADDRTLSILDPREPNPVVLRSTPVPVAPVALCYASGQIIVSCSDRTIRIFDERKFRTALFNSKPATKNGAAAVWSRDGNKIICVGNDERLTLVDRSEDVGQFKRRKYLAESPWVSAPSDIDGKFSLLTQNGVMHQFTDIVQFMESHDSGGDDIEKAE